MKITTQTSPFLVKYGIEKTCELTKNAGFDGFDFGFDAVMTPKHLKEKLDSVLYDKDRTIEYAKHMKEVIDSYGLKVYQAHSPFPTQFPLWSEEENELMFKCQINSLYACQILECPYLVVHPYFFGNPARTLSFEEEYEGNIKMYSALIPYMKETGVKVCLENMWSQQGARTKIFEAICEKADETNMYIDKLNEIAGEELFGFCCDTGHFVLCSLDIYKAIKKIGHRIKVFHIHDNNGWDDEHYIPGIGITNWDRFAKAVKEIGYTGTLNLEAAGTFDRLFKSEKLIQPAYNLAYATALDLVERIEKA